MDGVCVFSDVLADPVAYRSLALGQDFQTLEFSPTEVFRGIAQAAHIQELPAWIVARFPDLEVGITFFRRSPRNQPEPSYIHSDAGMGDWTGILYLNPDPPEGDGTSFWRHRDTGQIEGGESVSGDPFFTDLSKWERWKHVQARFNQLVLFRSRLFHSRGLFENYGAGDDARLIQVAFGTGEGL